MRKFDSQSWALGLYVSATANAQGARFRKAAAFAAFAVLSALQGFGANPDAAVISWGCLAYPVANRLEWIDAQCCPDAVYVSAGYSHNLVLQRDGTVTAHGTWFVPSPTYNTNGVTLYDPAYVPSGVSDVVAVSASEAHDLALRSDGTVVGWGAVPDAFRVPSGLSNVVAICAGRENVALKTDGTLVSWGQQTNDLSGLTNVVAISGSGGCGFLALKGDGTMVAWGCTDFQTNSLTTLSNIVAVSAGYNHWMALKADGSGYGIPGNASNLVAVAAAQGSDHQVKLALRADGTVLREGFQFCISSPPTLTNCVQISAGVGHSAVLIGGGPPFISAQPVGRVIPTNGSTHFRVEATGAFPLHYQWKHNGAAIAGANSPVLSLAQVQPEHAGDYSVEVTNEFGLATSSAAGLKLPGPAAPNLGISRAADHLVLAWPDAYAHYRAQRTADLASTNWVTVPDLPQANPATGQVEVALPLPETAQFYRLILQQ